MQKKIIILILVISIALIGILFYNYKRSKSNYYVKFDYPKSKEFFIMKLESNIDIHKLHNYMLESYVKGYHDKFFVKVVHGYVKIPIQYEGCYLKVYKENEYNSEFVLARDYGVLYLKSTLDTNLNAKGLALYYKDRQITDKSFIKCTCDA